MCCALPWRKVMSRTRWTLFALAVFAVGISRVAQAQGTITGRITAEGNQPLADARVIVVSTTVSATTNEDGRFTLKGVPSGTFDIQALHVGFQSQKKTVTVSAGASVTADFVMKQAIVQLAEIVTTA